MIHSGFTRMFYCPLFTMLHASLCFFFKLILGVTRRYFVYRSLSSTSEAGFPPRAAHNKIPICVRQLTKLISRSQLVVSVEPYCYV